MYYYGEMASLAVGKSSSMIPLSRHVSYCDLVSWRMVHCGRVMIISTTARGHVEDYVINLATANPLI